MVRLEIYNDNEYYEFEDYFDLQEIKSVLDNLQNYLITAVFEDETALFYQNFEKPYIEKCTKNELVIADKRKENNLKIYLQNNTIAVCP